MESILAIRARVAPLAWRVRWCRGIYWSTRCLLYSLLAALPLLLAKSVLPGPSGLWLFGLVIIGTGGGFFYGLSRPVPLADLARLIEERLDLKARLSTALEYHDRHDQSPFAFALYRDALRHFPTFKGKDVFPLRPPRGWWGLLPAAVAVFLLWFTPPVPWHRLVPPEPLTKAEQPQAEITRREPDEDTGQSASMKTPQIRDRRLWAGRTPFSRITRRRDAPFKDSPLSKGRPDFSGFLLRGDARMKFLGRSQALPDLRGADARSPYQIVVQKMRELSEGGIRHLTPDEVQRLLTQLQRMGKRGGFPGFAGSSGSPELADLTGEKAREALERALERLRKQEEVRLKKSVVPRGFSPGTRGGQGSSGGEEQKDDEPGVQEMFGSPPGQGRSGMARGDPTPRLDASPRDAGVKGQVGGGPSQAYTTNLLAEGRGKKPSFPQIHVLSRYRQIMEEALSREAVPPDYREQVKTYFDSLLQPKGERVR